MVIWPPTANPKVTAGLTWPPEMLAAIATATNKASPWQTATATRPAGSKAASAVNLSVLNQQKQTRTLSHIRDKCVRVFNDKI